MKATGRGQMDGSDYWRASDQEENRQIDQIDWYRKEWTARKGYRVTLEQGPQV